TASPPAPQIVINRAESHVHVTQVSHAPEIAPRPSPVLIPQSARVVSEVTRLTERLPDVAADEPSIAPAITTREVTAIPVQAPAARAEPAPDRTIHVRIGAIEIHAAPPGTPAPVAAAPVAAVPEPAPSPGNFDSFAR